MTHELLWNVLETQRANATFSGPALRAAAEDLPEAKPAGHTVLMAFDAAGERIIGAAMALGDGNLEIFDYTGTFPDRATCLLVGGFIAGPVGLADAAAAVIEAGARRVEAVIVGGPTDPVDGVARIRHIGQARAHVA